MRKWRKLSKSKTQKQFEENIGNIIRNSFILKKQNKKKIIKGRIIRDIRKPFEEEEKKEKREIKGKRKLNIE